MELINVETPEKTKEVAKRTGVSPTEIGFIKDGKTYTREEVQALPFDQLTLIQKLNRFREKSAAHIQQEIIFNPNHILAGLKISKAAYDDLYASRFTDQTQKKLSVIFSDLVGYAQQKAAEPVKQDIRQGIYYLATDTNEKEQHSRPSRFNDWDDFNYKTVHNSLVDVSLVDSSSFNGLGYNFAVHPAISPGPTTSSGSYPPHFFKIYVEQKHQSWKTYAATKITPVAR